MYFQSADRNNASKPTQDNGVEYEKVYVEVLVKFHKEGGFRPIELIWKDGRSYTIERFGYVCKAPPRYRNVFCTKFEIYIKGIRKYLYYEKELDRWFVERVIP